MKKTIDIIIKNRENIKGKYICVSNVHTTVMSSEDNKYKEIQNSAYMVLPDGGPLSFVSKLRGFKHAERVTGPDLMKEIFKISELYGYTHYFYGSTENTLEKLKINLKRDYPNLNIVGMYSPPFRVLSNSEDVDIINNINMVNADFLWVGLGAPKQEIWMYEHRNKIDSIMIGVGAGFDYFAGKIRRAPKWMQRLCLEWLYRLIQEPKRLFKRYFFTNIKFIKNAIILRK
ncbi:WecB/TagA/CpsF family glycosyltransferase [Clostridium perfringens]|nr:WecB/TagA/CpsF family glycosyltransferase [Clostridium perfringens]MDT7913802.1 WecB/TagA/CpsF family glycosyltransferase [Clostridium perfringens]MDT8011280.1 WecB/TagA/CpsF family glycosyltransferase [Clostridium perfringens]